MDTVYYEFVRLNVFSAHKVGTVEALFIEYPSPVLVCRLYSENIVQEVVGWAQVVGGDT